MTGDAIQNMRGALDHLAYQLFLVGSRGVQSDGHRVYFPISESAQKFDSSLLGKVNGMRPDAIARLRTIEPYKGGKGHQLWLLNELNNTDKHRLLLPIGAALRGVDFGPFVHRIAKEQVAKGKWNRDLVPDMMPPFFVRPQDKMCPLKAGDELFIDIADAEPMSNMRFIFDIALAQPGVVDGEPLIETLEQFAQLVNKTVLDFRPMLE